MYIWTSDLQRAHRLAPALDSAHTWVNSYNPEDLQAPSAGLGPDGLGAPGRHGSIDFYTDSRVLHIAADDGPVPRLGA